MNKITSHLSPQGYTFIELLIVFSIIAIIGWVGIASFVGFSNTQAVESAASDVAGLYTTARGRALSQIKPTQCAATQSLSAYRVVIDNAAGTYQVDALCGGLIIPVSSKKLPPRVSFDPSSQGTVLFSVPNATIASPATITITGYGKTKRVFIDGTGTIAIQ